MKEMFPFSVWHTLNRIISGVGAYEKQKKKKKHPWLDLDLRLKDLKLTSAKF